MNKLKKILFATIVIALIIELAVVLKIGRYTGYSLASETTDVSAEKTGFIAENRPYIYAIGIGIGSAAIVVTILGIDIAMHSGKNKKTEEKVEQAPEEQTSND